MKDSRFGGCNSGAGSGSGHAGAADATTSRDSPRRAANDPRGFMLLEVLVAFGIAVLALGVMMGAATGALQASRTAAHYAEATVRAQSRLTEAIDAGPLLPGQWEGSDGAGYRWRVRVMPAAEAAPMIEPSPPLMLYAVTVWISWRDGRRTRDVRLDTEHIGPSMQAR